MYDALRTKSYRRADEAAPMTLAGISFYLTTILRNNRLPLDMPSLADKEMLGQPKEQLPCSKLSRWIQPKSSADSSQPNSFKSKRQGTSLLGLSPSGYPSRMHVSLPTNQQTQKAKKLSTDPESRKAILALHFCVPIYQSSRISLWMSAKPIKNTGWKIFASLPWKVRSMWHNTTQRLFPCGLPLRPMMVPEWQCSISDETKACPHAKHGEEQFNNGSKHHSILLLYSDLRLQEYQLLPRQFNISNYGRAKSM